MGESHHQPSSRFGLQSAGGEIVEVQGGHIVRSTGRKDRHSKVCTAKGPRDRRVRLSAPTAIQFYDVQDRLGYDRPSKAVDWLIKKAKPAIDELAELPAWHPTATTTTTTSVSPADAALPVKQGHEQSRLHLRNQIDAVVGSSERTMAAETAPSSYAFQQQQSLNNPSHSSSFLPPSMDSDSIADTIKSFFPIAAAAAAATTSASSMHFHSYQPDLLSSTSGQAQDLRLSLQSFQDPILLHHQPQPQPHHHPTPSPSAEQALLCGSAPLSFDATSGSWSQQRPAPETGRFQRMVAWNSGTDEGGGGGFVYHFPPPPLQPLFGQSPFFSQRGPLQSSYSPSIRGWTDQQIAAAEHHQTAAAYPPSSGIGFASGGFSGFRIPARIQGEEEHDAVSNKPSSASRR